MSDFNQNIKKTLEQREITPSEKSWQNLENLLAENENSKKESSTKIWLGIAASFLLIALALGIFINIENNESPINPIVKENTQLEKDVPTTIKEESIENLNEKLPNSNSEAIATTNQVQSQPADINPIKEEKTITENSRQFDELAHSTTFESEENLVENTSNLRKDTLKNYELPSSDALLTEALHQKRGKSSDAIIVDSKKLLDKVDDQIYKDKSPDLLEKLTDKVKSIQVALSNRNQE